MFETFSSNFTNVCIEMDPCTRKVSSTDTFGMPIPPNERYLQASATSQVAASAISVDVWFLWKIIL